jgi:AcrR family transcriptional regulator
MIRTGAAESPEDVHHQIIMAATDRFRHFGYGKTTMAEIARDCDMSAGNLYRYFESKSDIGAAVGLAWFALLQDTVRRAIADPALSPAQKLETYVRTVCLFTLEKCRDAPRIQEMVDFLCEERRDLLMDHMAVLNGVVSGVIEEGVADGSFAVDDVPNAARAFQFACVHFEYPPLLAICDPEEVQEDIRRVVALLIDGLTGDQNKR